MRGLLIARFRCSPAQWNFPQVPKKGFAATGPGKPVLVAHLPLHPWAHITIPKEPAGQFCVLCFRSIFTNPAQSHTLIRWEMVELVPLCLWIAPASCLPEVHPHLWFNSLHLSGNHFHKSVSLPLVGMNKWNNSHHILSIEPSSQ